MKPYLRENVPTKVSDIPDTTAYEAGYLVTKNAGWRHEHPVIDRDKCTNCLQCYLYCPDGAIYRDDKVSVDYDFCKGCGVCKTVCKHSVIEMEAED